MFKIKRQQQSLELRTCTKPAILVMIGEESLKSVAKLAQKNQEKEKCIFTSTEYSVFKLASSLSEDRIKSISEHPVWFCCFLMSSYYFHYTVLVTEAK